MALVKGLALQSAERGDPPVADEVGKVGLEPGKRSHGHRREENDATQGHGVLPRRGALFKRRDAGEGRGDSGDRLARIVEIGRPGGPSGRTGVRSELSTVSNPDRASCSDVGGAGGPITTPGGGAGGRIAWLSTGGAGGRMSSLSRDDAPEVDGAEKNLTRQLRHLWKC